MIESEKLLEAKLRKAVENIGGLCFKFLPFVVNGIPDRICFFKGGRTVFVELKTTGLKPRKLQIVWLNKLSKLGFDCRVIDTTEKIIKLVEDYG